MRHFISIRSALVALLVVFALSTASAKAEPKLWFNSKAPNFTLTDTKGKKVSLKKYRNKKSVVIAFWSPDFQGSVGELAKLEKIIRDNKLTKKVKVLAVTFGKEVSQRDAAKKKAKEAGIKSTILFEKRTDLSASANVYMVTRLPTFFLVNKKGDLASGAITSVAGSVGGMSFKEYLKDVVDGKKMEACAFKPDRLSGSSYKSIYDMVGKKAPDFTAIDSKGKKRTLSSYKGKKEVAIVFWYPGCGHCRRELPQISDYEKKWAKKQKVQVMAVCIDDTANGEKDAIKFFDIAEIKYPLIIDKGGKVNSKYNVHSVPTMFLIDKKGVIQEAFVGEFSMVADILHCLFSKMK